MMDGRSRSVPGRRPSANRNRFTERLRLYGGLGHARVLVYDWGGAWEAYEVMLAVGRRRLLLGPDFRVSADGACRAELGSLHGASRVVA